MTIRSTVHRLVLAAICGGAVLSAPIIVTPVASGAPCPGGTISDPVTGVCWTQGAAAGNIGIRGTGGVCLPGRIGLCLAALQNSAMPGANLPEPPTTAGPNRVDSWP
jgi:hypothetical protein